MDDFSGGIGGVRESKGGPETLELLQDLVVLVLEVVPPEGQTIKTFSRQGYVSMLQSEDAGNCSRDGSFMKHRHRGEPVRTV